MICRFPNTLLIFKQKYSELVECINYIYYCCKTSTHCGSNLALYVLTQFFLGSGMLSSVSFFLGVQYPLISSM